MRRRGTIAALAAALLLVGCASREVVHHLRGGTMGTTFNVKFVAPDDREVVSRVQERIEAVLGEVNQRFSTWIPDSLISRFDAQESTEPFGADEEFVRVLRLSLRIAEWTDGAYDPTLLPVLELYGFGPGGDKREPGDEELAAALAKVGWQKLEILDGNRVRKLDPAVEVDLSSIAKGTGVDRVAAALVELGLEDHMVEIGGEVVCAGVKAAGQPWQIGIERPEAGSGRPIQEVIELRDRALATSGDYRNFFEAGGRRVHHVIDARTGRNADNGVVQVSVLAPDCTLADGLATALMIVGPEAAEAMLARPELAGVEALFLLRGPDGGVVERRVKG